MKTIITMMKTFLTLVAFSTIFIGCNKDASSPVGQQTAAPTTQTPQQAVHNKQELCKYLTSINACLGGINIHQMDSTHESQIMGQYKNCSQQAEQASVGTSQVVAELRKYKMMTNSNIGDIAVLQAPSWPTYLPESSQSAVSSANLSFSRCLEDKNKPAVLQGGLSYFPPGGSTPDQKRQHEEVIQIKCERAYDLALHQALGCGSQQQQQQQAQPTTGGATPAPQQ